MKLPALLLRFLPLWSYICPRCRREVKRNSHKCPYCGEKYGKPLKVPPLFLKNKEALEKYVHEKIFPRISVKQREYLAQFFTTIFEDGFESGDFSNWTGTSTSAGETAEVVTTDPHHGSYHAKFTCDGSSTAEYAYAYKTVSETVLYTRAYFKILTSLPASGKYYRLIQYRTDGHSNFANLGIVNSAGTIYWQIDCFAGTDRYQYDIQLDTWYCLEFYAKVNTASGELKGYINGEELLSLTADFSGDTVINRVEVGERYSNGQTAHTIYVDCVVVADTYIGEEGGVTEVQISDSASGNETLSRPYRGLSLIDQASGQDIFSRPYREIPILESTLGQELLLKTRSLSLSDIAASLEVIQKGRQLGAITDVAQGLEQILKQRLISLLDQAAGFETIARPTRVIVMADEALGREILGKLREVAAIADSAIGVEYINVGTEEARKTKIFLLIGDLAIQVTGD